MSAALPARRIFVLGSLHYDVMVAAPDRPRKGETLMGERWWPKCGGKGGNQAAEAALAGGRVAMAGAVGDDAFGPPLRAHLEAAGVDCRAIRTMPGAATGMSVAIMDSGGDYGAVVVSGVNRDVRADAAFRSLWKPGDLLVLQNEIGAEANRDAAEAAHEAGLRVLLNAAPARTPDPRLLDATSVLIVNGIEAEMTGSPPVTDRASALAAARALARLAPAVIVTAGGDGLAFVAEGAEGSLPAHPVRLVSTHGAGDCFAGTLAARLADGMPFAEAVAAANVAAGILVSLTDAERAARRPPRF